VPRAREPFQQGGLSNVIPAFWRPLPTSLSRSFEVTERLHI